MCTLILTGLWSLHTLLWAALRAMIGFHPAILVMVLSLRGQGAEIAMALFMRSIQKAFMGRKPTATIVITRMM